MLHLLAQLFLCLQLVQAFSLLPDRRLNQARTAPGFLVFPVYAHIPGIGSTYGAGFLVNNIAQSRTGLAGLASFGDTDTAFLQVNEINLVENQVIASFDAYSTTIPFLNYNRGSLSDMSQSFYSLNKEYGGSGRLYFMFFKRRLTFAAQGSASRFRYARVTASDGSQFNNIDNGTVDSVASSLHSILDLTDDAWDPRRGLKLELARNESAVFDRLHSRYYTLNALVTAYLPVFGSNTLALNAYRGQAFVYNKNSLTAAELQSAMALGCSGITDATVQATCQKTETQRAQLRAQENEAGTAGVLGGPNQLRGYPYGRFTGARSLFYGGEFRWNLVEGNRPFDLGFFQGTLSMIQLAPFYELGAFADAPQPVENAGFHSSYGIGLRVGFSGALVRADLGISAEGSQFTLFVGYPWDLPPF